MLDYALIISGIVILFLTILPPTWQVDIGTLIIGALLLFQGLKMLNEKIETDEKNQLN